MKKLPRAASQRIASSMALSAGRSPGASGEESPRHECCPEVHAHHGASTPAELDPAYGFGIAKNHPLADGK